MSPLFVQRWTPVKGLEGSLYDVLRSVHDGPGGGASGEVPHLGGEQRLVLLLLVKPGQTHYKLRTNRILTQISRRGDHSRVAGWLSSLSRTCLSQNPASWREEGMSFAEIKIYKIFIKNI